ncbi:hypothetical protein ACFPJ1_12050 [Kribbella qitaiheensis]|uniref:hypothetical protein n=1 Tax=Kribbella qitaiheensis TaxID=1544730 RepID=UPI0036092103
MRTRGGSHQVLVYSGVDSVTSELTGPVQLELAKAVEQLPGPHGMPGGSRYELKWDGFLH